MRKRLLSRIAILAVIYCVIFFLLVIVQFSNKGSFSLTVGDMTIRGRHTGSGSIDILPETIPITGGIRLYYGGLEFSLNEVRGKGLTVVTDSGRSLAVNPGILMVEDNTAHFGLPDFSSENNPAGPVITFTSISSERGYELLISVKFDELNDISKIEIPITPRRSSIIRDNDQLGIMYSGSRYLFGNGSGELEDGRITLTRESSHVSYKSRTRQSAFDPSVYILAQANNYESVFVNWREESYLMWNQNTSALQNEFDVMGYITEALGRRNYPAATRAISREFINSTRHSFRSAVFTGGMTNAYRTFNQTETSRMNTITSLVMERSPLIFREENIIDYLFTRSNTALAYDIVDIINNLTPEMITIDICPGLLETALDLRRWRPRFLETAANNPIESLLENILTVIQDNLVRDTENNLVLTSFSEGMIAGVTAAEFNMRLGKTLMEWAELTQDTDWLSIGKSLVLSGFSSEGPGNGRLYEIINKEANYPKAVWLMDNGLWAWTAASSARATDVNGDINISFNFPANMTHHVIIRGVRPFNRIQIHDTDWRTDSQFERYDSSGWVYYQQEQTLVLKLKHRETTENVRIIYRAPAPRPAPPPVPEPEYTEEYQYW